MVSPAASFQKNKGPFTKLLSSILALVSPSPLPAAALSLVKSTAEQVLAAGHAAFLNSPPGDPADLLPVADRLCNVYRSLGSGLSPAAPSDADAKMKKLSKRLAKLRLPPLDPASLKSLLVRHDAADAAARMAFDLCLHSHGSAPSSAEAALLASLSSAVSVSGGAGELAREMLSGGTLKELDELERHAEEHEQTKREMQEVKEKQSSEIVPHSEAIAAADEELASIASEREALEEQLKTLAAREAALNSSKAASAATISSIQTTYKESFDRLNEIGKGAVKLLQLNENIGTATTLFNALPPSLKTAVSSAPAPASTAPPSASPVEAAGAFLGHALSYLQTVAGVVKSLKDRAADSAAKLQTVSSELTEYEAMGLESSVAELTATAKKINAEIGEDNDSAAKFVGEAARTNEMLAELARKADASTIARFGIIVAQIDAVFSSVGLQSALGSGDPGAVSAASFEEKKSASSPRHSPARAQKEAPAPEIKKFLGWAKPSAAPPAAKANLTDIQNEEKGKDEKPVEDGEDGEASEATLEVTTSDEQ
ncbi:hypothetical protein TeGR_g11027 [Tetraparma gracilis]|uniref:Uncharacterized protein n=1 Tax=Tetraparma gracilis TaxID=2962635 RepID=A0ABQ6MNW3_9STRA|nr:hypothetical protein TeGR_g11027 [Tetraparma gracilis]